LWSAKEGIFRVPKERADVTRIDGIESKSRSLAMKRRYVLLVALTLIPATAHAQGDVTTETERAVSDVTVQIGQWSCDWAGGIAGGTSGAHCEPVRFDRPFGSAPKITVSFSAIPFPPALPGGGGGNISITASNITKDGFSPVLSAGILPQSRIEGSWIAVGR
jgi:hypothetical protein